MDLESQVVIHTELERRRQLFVLLTIIITHLTYYCTISIDSSVTHHTDVQIDEISCLSHVTGPIDEIFWGVPIPVFIRVLVCLAFAFPMLEFLFHLPRDLLAPT